MNTAINNRRNRVRQSSGDRIFDFIVTLIGVLIMLIVLIPLIFVLSASFSDPDLVLRGKVLLIPKGITFRAYTLVLRTGISGSATGTRCSIPLPARPSISF